jgi:NAD(P)-dependent dehydrogenase (short-subunit alcohol dehydrogenase family)
MSQPLSGKVAIVTGSSRGIGRAIAERLAADGAAVVVNYVRGEQAAQEVVTAIRGRGGRAVAVQADVSRLEEVQRLFSEARTTFGPPDIVVANAAVAVIKPIVKSTPEEFDFVFGANTRGMFFTLQTAARQWRDGRAHRRHIHRRHTHADDRYGAVSRQQGRGRTIRARAVARGRVAQHHRQRAITGIHGYRSAPGSRSCGRGTNVTVRPHR